MIQAATPIGVHDDVSLPEYLRPETGLSKSDLHNYAVSPAKWLRERGAYSPPTAAMLLGSAVDCAITEPDAFPLRYVALDPREIAPQAKSPRATNAWKEAVADMERAGREVLSLDDYRSCIAMRDAVHSHPAAKKLLKSARTQLTLIWERGAYLGADGQTYRCKSRPDIVGGGQVVNLKTAYSADWWKFSRIAAEKGYFYDVAWALEGWRVLTGEEAGYSWLVVDKGTLEVAVYEATKNMVQFSEQMVAKAWTGILDALDHEVTPPRYPRPIKVDPPAYAVDDDGDIDNKPSKDGWGEVVR